MLSCSRTLSFAGTCVHFYTDTLVLSEFNNGSDYENNFDVFSLTNREVRGLTLVTLTLSRTSTGASS